jgi:hypothetical protein
MIRPGMVSDAVPQATRVEPRDISPVDGSVDMERAWSSAPGVVVALGLAAVTVLGALAIPSPAWFLPVLAVAALVLLRPRSGPTSEPTVWGGLLHAALGASIGVAYLLLVIEL